MVRRQRLKEDWELDFNGEKLRTRIPFSIYNDLYRHGMIEDPFYRDNESQLLPLSDMDYTYRLKFNAIEEVYLCDEIFLQFAGVDTLSDIYLNGMKIGETFNMNRTWEFPVKELLKEQDNLLEVHFHSPTRYFKEQIERFGAIPCNTDTLDGFPYLRKSSCMSGWDWAPKLPDMGIFRNVILVGINQVRINDVLISQTHEEDVVRLQLTVNTNVPADDISFRYTVSLTDPEGNVTHYDQSPGDITIDDPRLWWPRGYGSQPLYRIRIEAGIGAKTEDVWERKIGLRTVGIHREKDQWGESFAHVVNGMMIFAMGADYIPEDSLLPRITEETTRKLLEQCAAANYNTIRVWGGGYYPDDWFYDICDELGLLVWQDLMFACSTYFLTEEFEENISIEIAENVKRIRHHASLGLWCGNNEMEEFLYNGYGETKRLKADYIKMFSHIIPKIIKKEDPDAFYWPSSPSSGGDFDDPGSESRGDAHYWGVWHGYEPFTAYRKHVFRYASEFGFESLPSLKTIESFTEPQDRNIFSLVMEKHQRSEGGYAKMMNYIAQTFLYPQDMSSLIYASQMMQAEAMKYAVEHWRRHRGQCMGTIIWQLNDCWPVASWSSIDYYGRWKALHYYEKRFFAPIMISCCEEGLLSQDPNPNARPYEVEKSIHLNVANETIEDAEVTVCWSLRNNNSDILGTEHKKVLTIPALSSVWLEKVELPQARLHQDHVFFSLRRDGEVISDGSVIFSIPKFYYYLDPQLKVSADGDELIVTAGAYAKGVEILNDEENLILSDNYFDMEAGEKRIKILAGKALNLRVRSVYDIGE
ncbi:MAG: beta-mannosidase [Lachnospiraceae bacterium]